VVLAAASEGAKTSLITAAAPPGRIQLVTVPGSAHGTALLAGSGSAVVLARIDAFLTRLR
jgi:hypothetical protein